MISNRLKTVDSQAVVISCDTYCTNKSLEVYPIDGPDPQRNATARAIYYAGCMDGCKNGPHAQ